MADKTITEVKQALIDALKFISVAHDYRNDFPPDHIYPNFDASVVNQKSDENYPKMFVVIDAGEDHKEPGLRVTKVLNFLVILIVKKINDTDDPQLMVESYIEDMEKLMLEHDTLGQTVQEAALVAFTTDSGYAFPEGVAVFRIETSRRVGQAS